jgi:WNK lysine deficient protein kinase
MSKDLSTKDSNLSYFRMPSCDRYIEVERSPNGQYRRYTAKLGEGASKRVWKAFDTLEGKVVAWNCAKYVNFNEEEEAKIRNEVSILKTLKHPNILELHDFWRDHDSQQICFITDVMADGRLSQFISRVGQVNRCVIKNWCRQILSALVYMHTQSPHIVHRDLKCDNIFIDSATSHLRIGDFGLSTLKNETFLSAMIGTPEFMAIEIFDEKYTEKIDIYAFGMTLLEMVTGHYPYEECQNNFIHVWKLVRAKIPPKALAFVNDPEVYSIIHQCIADESLRPSALQLLNLPFFAIVQPQDRQPVDLHDLPTSGIPPLLKVPSANNLQVNPDELTDAEKDQQKARLLEANIMSNWKTHS